MDDHENHDVKLFPLPFAGYSFWLSWIKEEIQHKRVIAWLVGVFFFLVFVFYSSSWLVSGFLFLVFVFYSSNVSMCLTAF